MGDGGGAWCLLVKEDGGGRGGEGGGGRRVGDGELYDGELAQRAGRGVQAPLLLCPLQHAPGMKRVDAGQRGNLEGPSPKLLQHMAQGCRHAWFHARLRMDQSELRQSTVHNIMSAVG